MSRANIKRAILLIFMAQAVMLPALAQGFWKKPHRVHLYMEPEGYLAWGEQDKFLFWDHTNNSEGLVSKLEWQERNVLLYGGKVGFSFDRLGAEFKILTAKQGESGEMYDSDWLNYDNTKTHYSINVNTVESCFRLEFMASFDFHPIRGYENFSLAPTAEFAYKNFLFSSENKEGWYGNVDADGKYAAWDSGNTIHYPNKRSILCGIDYEKIMFYSFLGFRAKLDLVNDRLHISLGGAVSPYSYAQGEDKHYNDLDRKKYDFYRDEANIFFKTFKGNFSTFFDINDIISLGLDGSGILSLQTKGPLIQRSSSDGVVTKFDENWGGFSEYEFQIGAGIRIHIF
ncbi:MAG: hypothetical protein ILP18_07155 [Treponema sp.]|nr:hypothetical protein [Treponema sp.]